MSATEVETDEGETQVEEEEEEEEPAEDSRSVTATEEEGDDEQTLSKRSSKGAALEHPSNLPMKATDMNPTIGVVLTAPPSPLPAPSPLVTSAEPHRRHHHHYTTTSHPLPPSLMMVEPRRSMTHGVSAPHALTHNHGDDDASDGDDDSDSYTEDDDVSDGPDLPNHLPPPMSPSSTHQRGHGANTELPFAARHRVTLRKGVVEGGPSSGFSAWPTPVGRAGLDARGGGRVRSGVSGLRRRSFGESIGVRSLSRNGSRRDSSREENVWLVTSTLVHLFVLYNTPLLAYLFVTLPNQLVGSIPSFFFTILTSLLLARVTTQHRSTLQWLLTRTTQNRDANLLMLAGGVAVVGCYIVPPFFTLLHAVACRVPVLGALLVFGGLVGACGVLMALCLVVVGLHTWDVTVVVHGGVKAVVLAMYGLAVPSSRAAGSTTTSTATASEVTEDASSVLSFPGGRSEAEGMVGRVRGGRRGSLTGFVDAPRSSCSSSVSGLGGERREDRGEGNRGDGRGQLHHLHHPHLYTPSFTSTARPSPHGYPNLTAATSTMRGASFASPPAWSQRAMQSYPHVYSAQAFESFGKGVQGGGSFVESGGFGAGGRRRGGVEGVAVCAEG
ncbi:hypothetical protein HDU67_008953 [Dinochytrium kinnereticum]|nr:hypothetical protein HDU67_008953 [Dinochytrium kinnereticum]